MSNPDPSRLEELAALQAMGLLDEAGQRELESAMDRDPAAERLVRDFTETAALLAHEAPEANPPPELRRKIMRRLPTPGAGSKIVFFYQWMPYAIAACLMLVGILQTKLILSLQSQLLSARSEAATLQQSNALMELRLATLEAKDAAYVSGKVLVAWDPDMHRGVISLENLPSPPSGHDYQLWVLDPTAPAPVNAGVITTEAGSRRFAVHSVGTESPGFAISLEPAGGSPEPTGEILFAVAPTP